MATGSQLFGRSFALQLASQQNLVEVGLDLRVKFSITANDISTPNAAVIRVYNLSDQRIKQLISEFTQVTVIAGYGENPGVIFKGNVKQFRRGKERNVDSYLDILAADGDLAYNFGFVNVSLPAGATLLDVFNQSVKAMATAAEKAGATLTADPTATQVLQQFGGVLPSPRGKVLFGLARSYMGDLAATTKTRWSIQNGRVVLVPLTGYLPGDIIKINSSSGMIGVPEATEQGITVTTLLNPAIQVGYQIQLNEADVTETVIKEQFFPEYTHLNLVATVDQSTEGLYRVIVIEHVGDTRGTEYYTKIIALKLDPSAAPTASVAAFG